MVQWAPTCPGSRLHFGFSSSSSAVPVPSANRIRASFPLPASACVASIDRMAGSTCWSSRQHVNIMTLRAMTSVMRLWRSATERRCQPIRRSVTDARVTLLLNLLIFLGGGNLRVILSKLHSQSRSSSRRRFTQIWGRKHLNFSKYHLYSMQNHTFLPATSSSRHRCDVLSFAKQKTFMKFTWHQGR